MKNSCVKLQNPTESRSKFAKTGHFYLPIVPGWVAWVSPEFAILSPIMAVFAGFSLKSTKSFVYTRQNGTTIALVSVQLLRYTQHPKQCGSQKRRDTERAKAMVTVKSSQKIFTDSEVATLTGICVDHLHNFAKSRHLGFIARAAERAGLQADQWLFTLSDLMVLVTLFPRCTH
jgi:hypothetical protein